MKTMKAAVLHAPGDLRVESVPVPVVRPGEALVRVKASGVCGSDLPRVRTTGTYRFPTIPGHEMAGVVEEIVSVDGAAPAVAVGAAVSVVPLVPCKRCRFCETGRFAQCEAYDFLGSRCDGGFAEYVRVPLDNLVPLPPGVSPVEGALLEPITVALHAVRNLGIAWGDTVAVFGLGAIGNFVAQWARVFGASRVFGIDLQARKVELARAVGLPDSFCSAGTDPARVLREGTGGGGVDVAFDASGSQAAITLALKGTRPFGRLGLLGRPVSPVALGVDVFEMILRGQITIRGTWSFEMTSFPHHPWMESAAALAAKSILADPLVTHTVSLEELPAAIEMMAGGQEFCHKVIVLPSGP